jgi:hypothetical protein
VVAIGFGGLQELKGLLGLRGPLGQRAILASLVQQVRSALKGLLAPKDLPGPGGPEQWPPQFAASRVAA